MFVPGCRYGRRTWWAKRRNLQIFSNRKPFHEIWGMAIGIMPKLGPGKDRCCNSHSSWFLMAPEPPLWGEWQKRPSFHHSPSGPPDRKFGIAIRACFHGCTCQDAPRNREESFVGHRHVSNNEHVETMGIYPNNKKTTSEFLPETSGKYWIQKTNRIHSRSFK